MRGLWAVGRLLRRCTIVPMSLRGLSASRKAQGPLNSLNGSNGPSRNAGVGLTGLFAEGAGNYLSQVIVSV